jgi:hypothetical protein
MSLRGYKGFGRGGWLLFCIFGTEFIARSFCPWDLPTVEDCPSVQTEERIYENENHKKDLENTTCVVKLFIASEFPSRYS